jgi:hypothetical protein
MVFEVVRVMKVILKVLWGNTPCSLVNTTLGYIVVLPSFSKPMPGYRIGHDRFLPDHSPPASAEVKKMWTYTSTPPYTFMA